MIIVMVYIETKDTSVMIIVLISRSNIGGREVSAMEQFFIWYYYNYSVRFFNDIQGISIILII